MEVLNVEEPIIAVRVSQYPEDKKNEFLCLGRSNVGKSSFINTIVNRKNIARTSSKPGKTTTLNFYQVNKEFYIVDVPGYGYAATNKKQIEKFGIMIEEYLKTHKSKYKLILLVALYTEMRIGEILALRPSDINIVGNIGSINVRRTLTKAINTYGYIYSYLRQKELNQKYTKYMQDTNAILEENFERFEEEYLKLK